MSRSEVEEAAVDRVVTHGDELGRDPFLCEECLVTPRCNGEEIDDPLLGDAAHVTSIRMRITHAAIAKDDLADLAGRHWRQPESRGAWERKGLGVPDDDAGAL